MTTLYRTPNVIIDRHEWHAVVRKKHGRVLLTHWWRPLTTRSVPWSCITTWQGPKPKRFGAIFWRFRGHIREAMGSEGVRAAALAGRCETLRLGRKVGHKARGLLAA